MKPSKTPGGVDPTPGEEPKSFEWVDAEYGDYDRQDGFSSYDLSRVYRNKPLRHWIDDDDDDGDVVDPSKCTGCGACENYCPSHAMRVGRR